MTPDTWHLTHDMWQMVGGRKAPAKLGLLDTRGTVPRARAVLETVVECINEWSGNVVIICTLLIEEK